MDKAIYFDYGGANIYRMSAIGARLRELRKSLKLGQDDVADEIGVTQSMISDYESKGVMFGADKLALLAEVPNTTMDYIMYGAGQVDKDEARLLGHFRAMTPDLRDTLLKSASTFAAAPRSEASTRKASEPKNRKAA